MWKYISDYTLIELTDFASSLGNSRVTRILSAVFAI